MLLEAARVRNVEVQNARLKLLASEVAQHQLVCSLIDLSSVTSLPGGCMREGPLLRFCQSVTSLFTIDLAWSPICAVFERVLKLLAMTTQEQ
jgi:hypothetical protein